MIRFRIRGKSRIYFFRNRGSIFFYLAFVARHFLHVTWHLYFPHCAEMRRAIWNMRLTKGLFCTYIISYFSCIFPKVKLKIWFEEIEGFSKSKVGKYLRMSRFSNILLIVRFFSLQWLYECRGLLKIGSSAYTYISCAQSRCIGFPHFHRYGIQQNPLYSIKMSRIA